MGTSIKTWFTSDTHLSHPSILYFHPKRRMAAGITLEELQADKKTAIEKHDEWLIDLWNKTVKKQETICLKANDENYIVTINKLPPLIIGDYVRVFATSESIYKGTDGIYRVSSVMHIYKIKKEQEEIDD